MSIEAPTAPAATDTRARRANPHNQRAREQRRQAAHQQYQEEKAALASISNIFLAEDFFGLQPYYSGAGESKYLVGGYKLSVDKRKATQPFSSLGGDEFFNGNKGGHGPVSLFRVLCAITGLEPQPADMAKNQKRYDTGDPEHDAYMKAHRFMLENFVPHALPENVRKSLPAPKKPAPLLDLSKMEKDIQQGEERPVALPKHNVDVDGDVRSYLVEKRGLPEKLVDTMIGQRVVYGAIREQEMKGRGGNPYTKKIPTVVIPFRGVETNIVNAYSHIDLKGNFKGNRGQMSQAVFRIGKKTEDTKEVVITEAVIDALSKWSIDRPGRDTVIDAMAGSRLPVNHVKEAKENGHTLVLAHDADMAGRNMARNLYNLCREEGVPVRADMMEGAVLEVAFDHSAKNWEQRVEKLSEMARGRNIAHTVAANDEGTKTSVFMPSTKETDPLLKEIQETYRSEDQSNQEALKTAYKNLHGLRYAPKKVPVITEKVYMKDWNDQLLFQRNEEQNPDRPKAEHVPGLPTHFKPFPYPEGEKWGLNGPSPEQSQESKQPDMDV